MTRYRAPRTLLAFALALGGLPSAAAADQLPKYWVFGTELPSPPPAPKGPTGLAAPGAENGKLAQYDYPGEYAQRFDGVDKGGRNESITIHGQYDLSHRLHRNPAPRALPKLKTK